MQRCDTCSREIECWGWTDDEGLEHSICKDCLHLFVENDRRKLRGDPPIPNTFKHRKQR